MAVLTAAPGADISLSRPRGGCSQMTGRRSGQDEDLRNGGAFRFRRLVRIRIPRLLLRAAACVLMFRFVDVGWMLRCCTIRDRRLCEREHVVSTRACECVGGLGVSCELSDALYARRHATCPRMRCEGANEHRFCGSRQRTDMAT